MSGEIFFNFFGEITFMPVPGKYKLCLKLSSSNIPSIYLIIFR